MPNILWCKLSQLILQAWDCNTVLTVCPDYDPGSGMAPATGKGGGQVMLEVLAGEQRAVPPQGFFSKFLMGGGLEIVGPRRGRSRMGGGTYEKNPTEAKTAHLMQN